MSLSSQQPRVQIEISKRHTPIWQSLLVAAVSIAALYPLWAEACPPSLDWPQHVAVIDVLVRLLRKEAAVSQYYALNLQPVGYYLFYTLATPIAFALGAATAVRLVMSAILLLHISVLAWACRKRQWPAFFALVGIPAFYSGHFAWGFLPTLTATPFVFVALFLLLEATQSLVHAKRIDAPIAALSALLASMAHVIFAPLLFVASGLTVAIAGQRTSRVAQGVALGAGIVMLPAVCARGFAIWQAMGTAQRANEYTSLWRGITRFADVATSFDRSFACCGWVLLWTVLLILSATRYQQSAGQRRDVEGRCLIAWIGICVAHVWVVPVETFGPVGTSFFLNLRALCLLPFLFTCLAAPSRLLLHRHATLTVCCALVLSASLTVVGVTRLGRLYAQDVNPWLASAETLPAAVRLGIRTDRVEVGDEWPPLRLHMASIAFPEHFIWQNTLFANGHLPIRERVAGSIVRLDQSVTAFEHMFLDELSNTEVGETVWQRCDAIFYQDPNVRRFRLPVPEEGVLMASGRQWRLLGPPIAQRATGEAPICGSQYVW